MARKRRKKKINFPIIIILALIIVASVVLILTLKKDPEEDYTFLTDNAVYLDPLEQTGVVKLKYGANENDNWMEFVDYPQPKKLHRDVGSSYIRVWISNPSWRESTIPLESWEYDYGNLDQFISSVLEIGSTPFVVFAHAPAELSVNGVSSNKNPPRNNEEFADYVSNVISHINTMCVSGKYPIRCNINDWYFEIWNEPWEDIWWEDDRYIRMYNDVHRAIRIAAPSAKIGGYVLGMHDNKEEKRLKEFLQKTDSDFISLHYYGNSNNEHETNLQMMINSRDYLLDQTKFARSIIDEFDGSKELVISEYNSDFTAKGMDHLDEPYTAAWTASALINMVKSSAVDMELFYSGTSNFPDRGFGMWSDSRGSFKTWPVYEVKKSFVQNVKYGTPVVLAETNSVFLDVLAVKNGNTLQVVLVNKEPRTKEVSFYIEGEYQTMISKNNPLSITNNNVNIVINPYETLFLVLN